MTAAAADFTRRRRQAPTRTARQPHVRGWLGWRSGPAPIGAGQERSHAGAWM